MQSSVRISSASMTSSRSGEPAAYLVEYGALYQALEAAVRTEKSIEIFAPDTVVDYSTDDFSAVAKLGSGAEIKARLLVASDGKRSRLREAAGIKCVSWSYPQVGIVTTVAHTRPHHGRAVQHFLPAGPFAMLPLTGNRSSIVWTEEKERGAAIMALDAEDFTRELATRFGARLGEIKLAGPRQSFPLEFQIARSFIADRLALIGDAAHVVHPLAGQGLNIGMRDVAALAETIVEEARLGLDIGSGPGLERYQRWRRFDSAFSGAVMDGLNRLFSNDNAPLRVLRDLGLGLVDRVPELKRFLVREAAGGTGNVPRLLRASGCNHGAAIDDGKCFTPRYRRRRGRPARPRRDHQSPVASTHHRRFDWTYRRASASSLARFSSPDCYW